MPAITPVMAMTEKGTVIPDLVIECFNECIRKNLYKKAAHVKQKEVVALIKSITGATSQQIFDNHWLDIKDTFEKAGWSVEYDKPGYNEHYDAHWIFRCK